MCFRCRVVLFTQDAQGWTGRARMNRTRKPKLPSLMKRCVSLEKQTCFAQELSMNSTSSSLMKRCVGYFYFCVSSFALSCVSPPVSTFWSVGPSNLLKENANVELKRESKHNLKELMEGNSFPTISFTKCLSFRVHKIEFKWRSIKISHNTKSFHNIYHHLLCLWFTIIEVMSKKDNKKLKFNF